MTSFKQYLMLIFILISPVVSVIVSDKKAYGKDKLFNLLIHNDYRYFFYNLYFVNIYQQRVLKYFRINLDVKACIIFL